MATFPRSPARLDYLVLGYSKEDRPESPQVGEESKQRWTATKITSSRTATARSSRDLDGASRIPKSELAQWSTFPTGTWLTLPPFPPLTRLGWLPAGEFDVVQLPTLRREERPLGRMRTWTITMQSYLSQPKCAGRKQGDGAPS